MKKLLVTVLPLLLAISCIQEEMHPDPTPEAKTNCAKVQVMLLEEDASETKSVVSSAVENFTCAYLFAFDSGTKALCINEDGSPVSLFTEQKSFDWTLPVGLDGSGKEQHLDIWTIVNPDENNELILNDFLRKTDLWERDLEALTFSCADADAMLRMESYGMPMSGMLSDIYLESQDDPIVFTLRRLFARYDLKINTSLFESQGWNITAAQVEAARSNTSVPFFYTGGGAGYKAGADDLATVDFATEDDLAKLNTLDAENQSVQAVTLYFLENCQGDASPAADKWNTVGSQLSGQIQACSYVEFSVTASKSGYGSRLFKYRLYPGQKADMCSNFDIIRNKHKKINITLEAPTDGFCWTNREELSIYPGESVSIPFETSLLYSPDESVTELVFPTTRDGSPTSDLVLENVIFDSSLKNTDRPAGERLTNFRYFGTATFRALDSAEEGSLQVIGCDKSGDISAPADVEISCPFYKGLQLGRLGFMKALGVPVDTSDGESTWMKAVTLPGADVNQYLWEGVGNEWQLRDAFSSKYDVTIDFVCASEGAYPPNVKLWWFDNGSYPRRFYYGASSMASTSCVMPAHCIVKIHCKDDANPTYRTWFEFDNFVQYNYSFKMTSEHTSTSWTGQVSADVFAKCISIERGSPTVYYDQPIAFFDLHPQCVPALELSLKQPSSPYGTTSACKPGIKGGNINLAKDVGFNPIYTDMISGKVDATLSGGYTFPDDFDGWYFTYNAPKASLNLIGVPTRTLFLEGVEYYILPSYYLTYTYKSYQDGEFNLPFYPGMLLRKWPEAEWANAETGPTTPYITFYGPADEVAAGSHTAFHYKTNLDGNKCVFSVEPHEYFHISSTDKRNCVIDVYCEENTIPGTVATLKAFNTDRTASDTHVFKTITDHYSLSLYAAFDYRWNFPFVLQYSRTNTDYYAFTLETVRKTTSIPVLSYNGRTETIRTPNGRDRFIEDVIACIECEVAGKPGKKCYLYPKHSEIKGQFWYHNNVTCYSSGSVHQTENEGITRDGGYYGCMVSFSAKDSDLSGLGNSVSLSSFPYYPLIPISFSFTEEFMEATKIYPKKVQLMKAAYFDYD